VGGGPIYYCIYYYCIYYMYYYHALPCTGYLGDHLGLCNVTLCRNREYGAHLLVDMYPNLIFCKLMIATVLLRVAWWLPGTSYASDLGLIREVFRCKVRMRIGFPDL